jgi:CRP-like cAMP-binding protein
MSDDRRRNAILGRLPDEEFDALAPLLTMTDATVRQEVYAPGGAIDRVYFPIDAVFSLVALVEGQVVVEAATMGRESIVGLPLFLGATSSPHASFCQVPGRATSMTAEDFGKALAGSDELAGLLSRCTQATLVQTAQNVACNSTHRLEQRACRWLLTTHDRVDRDEFSLTQEFFAQMLAVRRPTLSEVAASLQGRGLIRYRRGVMTILDRQGIEARSCDCYRVVKAEFDALMPPEGEP